MPLASDNWICVWPFGSDGSVLLKNQFHQFKKHLILQI